VYVYAATAGSVPDGLENISNGKSNVQKLIVGRIPAAEAPWGTRHFTYNNVVGNIVTGLSEEGKAKLKNNSELIIPSRINGTTVTGIANGTEGIGTFGYTEGGKTYVPKKVILPRTLKSIGDYAFDASAEGVSGLTEIELPDQLETIGNYAFRNSNATELQIPKSVKTIGKGAFEVTDKNGAALEKVSLSMGLTSIPENAFRGQKLKSVTLPKNITEIGSGAFADNKVENLALNEELKTIGNTAFENHQLKKLVLSDNVTEIGDFAFAVTDSNLKKTLTELKLNRKLKSIGENAFGRSAVKETELPDSVEVLPASAFNGNTAVAEVWTSSDKQASGETPYEKVTAKGDGHQLKYDKLVGTGWEYSDFVYSEDGKTIVGLSKSGKDVRMSNHHLVLPDKASREAKEYITVIGEEAFAFSDREVTVGKYDCTSPNGFQSVKFPKYLERIEAKAFEYNNLRNHDKDGNVVNTPTETTGEDHFLADQKYLTYVGGSAFRGNHLCNVALPDAVTAVGDTLRIP
ncbi:MAG: leucine-rich repeat protein, partial [Clostridia bacterium]|nr:leucine-rich repeat protein [Clostridia bacterium]